MIRKKWVVLVADKNEVQQLNLEQIKKSDNFISYKKDKYELIFFHSGIGLINAAASTQYCIDKFKPELIINYGAVGSSSKNKLFDIILPSKFYCHDAKSPWYDFGVIPHEDPYYNNLFTDNKKINISSGNKFISKPEDIQIINSYYQADIYDMESFAYAAIARKNDVPFLSVKAVSDVVGETNTDINTINENIKKAAKLALSWILDNLKIIEEKNVRKN